MKNAAISVRIDQPTKTALERAAAADRRSLTSLVAKVFDDFLAGNDNAVARRKPADLLEPFNT